MNEVGYSIHTKEELESMIENILLSARQIICDRSVTENRCERCLRLACVCDPHLTYKDPGKHA